MSIFQNVPANGNGTYSQDQFDQPLKVQKFSTLFVGGTFGGANIASQISPDGAEWFPFATDTAPGFHELPAGLFFIRFVVTGATGTTNVNINVR